MTTTTATTPAATLALLTVELRYEQDVVLARQRARQIAGLLGFQESEQTALATAASELARNAFRYAGRGQVAFSLRLDPDARAMLIVRVSDSGPGIANAQEVLEGRYRSRGGMGLGLIGSKRLSDEFDLRTAPGAGTTVTIGRRLPPAAPPATPALAASIAAELAGRAPRGPLEEMQEQNRELMRALDELRARQADVERLNAELAETNRGVVALYAELDEKAESLRRASEYKTRFLSDMTHELRTPLNAITSLARLLIDRVDGELTPEQARQASLIHRSATSLGEMVNDLLDLAKIEAGKTDVHVAPFRVDDVLATLRGVFRTLVPSGVALAVEEPAGGLDVMVGDERKVSQILRNLVSNALKFTERGEVRVAATADAGGGTATFTIRDTGIGIAADHLEAIFEEYTQIDGPVQRRVRGTGLGLPLTRKLARLMGGDVGVASEPGAGSTFTVTLPVSLDGRDGDEDGDGDGAAGGNGAGGGSGTRDGSPEERTRE